MELQIRPLEEETLQDFITDPILTEGIKKVTRNIVAGEPVVSLDNSAFQEMVMKKILGALVERDTNLMRQLLDTGEASAHCLTALIFEREVRNPMLRVMVFREDDARKAVTAYEAKKLSFERPHYENRIKTISKILEYWDAHRQVDSDDSPVRRLVVGYQSSNRPS
jgi:hypothetical protein